MSKTSSVELSRRLCYPLSSYMMQSVPGGGLDGISERGKNYTRQEQQIQQVLAVASSSISMLSGFISFYWFVTMKRNFRHQYVDGTQPLRFETPGC